MLRVFNVLKRTSRHSNGAKFARTCSSRLSVDAQLDRRTNVAPATSTTDKYRQGQMMHGFLVKEVSEVDELHLVAVRLTHLATGAQYLHLQRDDSNNVFSVGLRTTPMDSTGLPHILEHTTLCGSERFPCRDPFFKMLRRSLATFMNAMTGPDYTMYPFSTQNQKDFRNLQAVYLDCVFKPNLRELDFRQEGWRLEHAEVNDKTSPIIFKGVVFNEMKGAFSENQVIFAERLLNSILPSHTYGVISGGDPLVIPQLTHADLVNFHSSYYHPSNARFYSYGNFPLEDHLKFINDRYLFLADREDTSKSEVPPEKRWDQPRREHISCRPDPMAADQNKQSSVAIGHLCSDITNVQETFELYVLSQLLLKGPNSAFYKSLVETNIGAGFSPVTGYDAQSRDTMFVVGLQGVREEDFGKVEEIFNDTVAKVVVEGFDKDQLEAVLHGIELQVKHQTSNFGLNLLFNLTSLWNHGGDLVQSMKVNQAVGRLRDNMRNNPSYLQDLVAKHLMHNRHRLVLTMSPDEAYDLRKVAEEKALLDGKLKSLSQDDLERIYQDGLALQEEQRKTEDAGVLPTLKMEDLKDDVERFDFTDLKVLGIPLQLAVQPTNGVSYFRGILDIGGLSDELKELLPLFNNVVSKMGTRNYDYRSFDQMVQLKTGGLDLLNHVAESKNSVLRYEEGVMFHSFCLDRNANDMWRLWEELFNNVKLTDLQRFETLVKIIAANLVNGIADSGHVYAMSSSAGLVSPTARRRENWSGLNFIARMKNIAQLKDLGPVLEQMQEISKSLLTRSLLRSALNLSPESKNEVLSGVQGFYEALRENTSRSYDSSSDKEKAEVYDQGVHHVLPLPVNYTSKTILTVPYTDPHYAPLRVLSKLVTSAYLHPEVREKGGAYGGGARLSSEGAFSFYSYRDPNSTKTLDVFDQTYDFLTRYSFPQDEIDEAKLGVFQQIDAPVPPGNRGMTRFIHDLSDDEIQRQRQELKAVTREELMEVAQKYLRPDQEGLKVGRALIGPVNPDLLARKSETWTVLDQEEMDQAQMAD